MQIRRCTTAAVATLGAAALSAVGVAAAGTAQASSHVRLVVAHVNSKHVLLSTGHSMSAGTVRFRVVSHERGHSLQIARLHHGYTLQQAQSDLSKAMQGDVAAVRRVDKKITFRGGAPARPGHNGLFAVTLAPGRYLFLDQNGSAHTWLNVTPGGPRQSVSHHGHITAFSYGFGNSGNLRGHGKMRVRNVSDQPHFVVFQHVKPSTTHRQVRKFLDSGAQGRPSFLLRGSTETGVISPYHGEVFRTHLPAGKYVILCFWPDDETGMPHAFMGMWKLLRLH